MGCKWEVLVWTNIGEGYRHYTRHQGQSLCRAIWEMLRARREGIGCIALKWR
ncbi:hypothetical protein [Nocardia sp. SC052]|uniref:hypothetical protein n=1 Tax=Nocardia sichangensis TaxID=3385975 RepID=UPI00399FB040